MKNPFNHPAMIDISLLLGRVALGLYVLLEGWHLLAGPGLSGSASMVAWVRPSWAPEGVARAFGYVMPVAELLSGMMLIAGLFTRWAGGVMTVLLVGMFIGYVNYKGITGGADGPFHYTAVFAPMAFMIAIIGPGRLALDPLYFGGGGRG
ncbi:MAG: DoxX family protein [Tepidisphaeraceae bacterium]